MAIPKFEILILTDSRGTALKPRIDAHMIESHITNINVTVKPYRGKELAKIVSMGIRDTLNEHYDVVYLFGGVNDLSSIHDGYVISPRYNEAANLIEVMSQKFYDAKDTLMPLGEKIVICHLVGLNFETYNKGKKRMQVDGSFESQQTIINEGVIHVNHNINLSNIQSNVKGPWISETVHCLKHSKYTHRYKAMYDGIHPNSQLLDLWAKKFVASFRFNIHATCN